MKTTLRPPDAETKKRLTTLVERAKALDTIFACGGEVEVAALFDVPPTSARKRVAGG